MLRQHPSTYADVEIADDRRIRCVRIHRRAGRHGQPHRDRGVGSGSVNLARGVHRQFNVPVGAGKAHRARIRLPQMRGDAAVGGRCPEPALRTSARMVPFELCSVVSPVIYDKSTVPLLVCTSSGPTSLVACTDPFEVRRCESPSIPSTRMAPLLLTMPASIVFFGT